MMCCMIHAMLMFLLYIHSASYNYTVCRYVMQMVKYKSINQSINSIRVHHATEALGHNMVQNSTMTT